MQTAACGGLYRFCEDTNNLQATELPSMHLALPREMPEAFRGTRQPAPVYTHTVENDAKIPATYFGATCSKPPTCRTPNLCPSSTLTFPTSHFALPSSPILGPMAGEGVLFLLRSVSCDITLHDTAPHQHNDPPRVGGLGGGAEPLLPPTLSNTPLPPTGLKEPTPTKFSLRPIWPKEPDSTP